MKQFKLSTKFYIIFCLVLVVPASYVSAAVQAFLGNLDQANILRQFADLGIIQAPTTVVLLLLMFWIINKWLWRIPLVNRIPSIVPVDINGRYEGDLISSYDKSKVYKIIIEIKQSLTDIVVNLYTANSSSHSLVATVGKNSQGNWCISYLYQNKTGTVNHDEDMKDHGGAAFLEIFNNGEILKGSYFNNPRDRGHHGSIEAQLMGKKLLGRFS